MPTTKFRKSRKPVNAQGLSEAAYEFFTFGDFFDGEIWAQGKTESEISAFWKAHRQAIMARYMAENRARGPGWEGRRPEYFWKELTEPRLPVDMTLRDDELYDVKKVGYDGLEADYAFLKRLNLLEDWELENQEENHERR